MKKSFSNHPSHNPHNRATTIRRSLDHNEDHYSKALGWSETKDHDHEEEEQAVAAGESSEKKDSEDNIMTVDPADRLPRISGGISSFYLADSNASIYFQRLMTCLTYNFH